MKLTENPYKGLLELHRRIAKGAALQPTAGIGTIISPPPGIQISYHGFILDKERTFTLMNTGCKDIQEPIKGTL